MLHIISPILYSIFVKIIQNIQPDPKSVLMKRARKIHNITLSFLSFLMCIGIFISNYKSKKLNTTYNILCKPYISHDIIDLSFTSFLYSKYLEWGDTFFLHASGKKISMLQYTHHMSTAFLMYFNMIDHYSSHLLIFVGSNCFVHIPMYWYFAYPKGILNKYRKYLTILQITQHVICIFTILYTFNLQNCNITKYGNHIGLLLYLMYLLFFAHLYVQNYTKIKA